MQAGVHSRLHLPNHILRFPTRVYCAKLLAKFAIFMLPNPVV